MIENKINYGRLFDEELARLTAENRTPRLLLHSCCAPCSSAVLERLYGHFHTELDFFNPNITPSEEFYKRLNELERLIETADFCCGVSIFGKAAEEYDSSPFFELAQGLENEPEGGSRCERCYELRLRHTAKLAAENGFDYFCTTLSVSPYKNAEKLNIIGKRLAEEYGVAYLFSDFKKRGGYQRSCELSREFSLYRQSYCGCVFSANAGKHVPEKA